MGFGRVAHRVILPQLPYPRSNPAHAPRVPEKPNHLAVVGFSFAWMIFRDATLMQP